MNEVERRPTQEVFVTTYANCYLEECANVLGQIDVTQVEALARCLAALRDSQGRLFILGVGGSAGHASHAVNDFRKLCGIESYSPTDNVSELTARVNDDGWETTFSEWLKVSRLGPADALLVFSVGGGSLERNISPNLVRALELAQARGAQVLGIVGKDGGATKRLARACVVIPPLYPDRITPHTEGLAAVVWHLLVSHPLLQRRTARWEFAAATAATAASAE